MHVSTKYAWRAIVLLAILGVGIAALQWKYDLLSRLSHEDSITVVPQTPDITLADDCIMLERQIRWLFSQSGACTVDRDCTVSTEFWCPFGAWQLLNRNVDLTVVRAGIEKYNESCLNAVTRSVCEVSGSYDRLATPRQSDLVCRNGGCVDIRFFLKEGQLALELTASKGIFEIGESIALTLKVVNASPRSIRLPESPFLQQFVTTEVHDQHGTLARTISYRAYAFDQNRTDPTARNPIQDFLPGESRAYPLHELPTVGKSYFPLLSFPEAGVYWIKSVLAHAPTAGESLFWTGRAESNDLVIKVVEG